MDERIIEAASTVLGCSYEKAEEFLESERGCYADIDGRSIWMCGALIRRVAQVSLGMDDE